MDRKPAVPGWSGGRIIFTLTVTPVSMLASGGTAGVVLVCTTMLPTRPADSGLTSDHSDELLVTCCSCPELVRMCDGKWDIVPAGRKDHGDIHHVDPERFLLQIRFSPEMTASVSGTHILETDGLMERDGIIRSQRGNRGQYAGAS